MPSKKVIESMAAKERKKRGSTEKYKFLKARNLIRVMPPAHGMPIWWFTAYVHWTPKVTDGKETKFPVLCNDQHGIGECKICKRRDDILANPNAQVHEIAWANQVESAATNFVSVINLEDIVGPQITAMCNTIFDRLIALETEGYEISDPKKGFDIVVNREMKGGSTYPSYTADTVRHPSEMEDTDVLKNLADLLTQVPIFTPAQQDAIIRMDGEAIEADDAGRNALRSKLRASYVAEANGEELATAAPTPLVPAAPAPVAEPEDTTTYWIQNESGAVVLADAADVMLLPKASRVMVVGSTEWTTVGEIGMGV